MKKKQVRSSHRTFLVAVADKGTYSESWMFFIFNMHYSKIRNSVMCIIKSKKQLKSARASHVYNNVFASLCIYSFSVLFGKCGLLTHQFQTYPSMGCRHGGYTPISHLFFVDDIIIFTKGAQNDLFRDCLIAWKTMRALLASWQTKIRVDSFCLVRHPPPRIEDMSTWLDSNIKSH